MNFKANLKNRIPALVLLTSVGLLFSNCKKDNLLEPSADLSQQSVMPTEIKSEVLLASGITADSYYLENSLPSGYVKDGSKDYTSYVQAAVSKYSNVVFPGFPILVNDKGITIGSNKTITFQPGSELRLKGTSKDTYTILNIYGVSNVTLYNPVVTGDRNSHIGTSGEYGVGIGIRGSNNITIYSPKVTNCWGDGMYIGQTTSNNICKNITIKDAYLRKNRRDGIGIISVDGLLLDNPYAGYTDGTSPMSGINFEPNNPSCDIKNVRVNNPHTEFNGANGIQIGTRKMLGSSNKQSDITIVNHVDIASPKYAFKVSCVTTDGVAGKLSGTINVINPSWQQSGTKRPLVLVTNQPNYKFFVYSPEVSVLSGPILSWTETYNMLMKEARTGIISVNQNLPSGYEPTAPVVDQAPATQAPTSQVVFAVNAGGSAFTASNGITYSADKNFSGGSVFKTSNAIDGSSDDALYQSERYGNFNYAIPVSNGTYEITFKMAELYHSASGKRQFDILAENTAVISNLDLFNVSGSNTAYDVTKTVIVNDGTLNLEFHSDIDKAKISAFHVIKK